MKAEELRIGNCVNYFNDGEHSLIRILDWGYAHLNDASSIDYELLKPIPLTEEWLLKFGFEYFADGQYEKKFENLDFNWDKECGLYIYLRTREDNIEANHIKHVHQLQNIYYALTQKELKYEG